MKSIRAKFILLNLISILLCTMIIGGVSLWTITRRQAQSSDRILLLSCREYGEELNEDFYAIETFLNVFAESAVAALDALENLPATQRREIPSFSNKLDCFQDPNALAAYLATMRGLMGNLARNTPGIAAYYLRFAPELTEDPTGFLYYRREGDQPFMEKELTPIALYAPDDTERVGWYYQPMNAGKPVWMEPYWNRNLEIYMISYVVPLYYRGTFIGIAGMDMDFPGIVERIRTIRTYSTGYAFLLSPEGRVYYHPELETGTLITTTIPELSPMVEAFSRYEEEARLTGHASIETGIPPEAPAPPDADPPPDPGLQPAAQTEADLPPVTQTESDIGTGAAAQTDADAESIPAAQLKGAVQSKRRVMDWDGLLDFSNLTGSGTLGFQSEAGSGGFRYHFQGQGKKLAYCTLDTGARLILTAQTSEINTPMIRLAGFVAMVAVLMSVGMVLVTLSIAEHITRPLAVLTRAANQIAEGHMNVELPPPGDDEVGILSRSFAVTTSYLKKYIAGMNDLAYLDPLTGVKNKAAYNLALEQLKVKTHLGIANFGILMLDVNNLKKVNDQFGHDRGNDYLICNCSLICRVFTHSPVYRIGGDEFVVILEGRDRRNCKELMAEMDLQMAESQQEKEPWKRMSIAKGVSFYHAGDDPDEVFRRADQIMYEDKRRIKGVDKPRDARPMPKAGA